MKQYLTYLLIIFSGIFFSGCQKNKPKPGIYVGEFTYTDLPATDPMVISFMLKETGKDHIIISVYSYPDSISPETLLQKKKDQISGNLFFTTNPALFIDGIWEKKKGKYIIKGIFTQSGETSDGSYTHSGTFELKSQSLL